MNILVTGAAGFIGSHLVRLLVNKYPGYTIIAFDSLTYAGNLENLSDVMDAPNYRFIKGDITSEEEVMKALNLHDVTDIIHLAAESHVDRSIEGPMEFVKTNVFGTVNLMNQARAYWGTNEGHVFYHVSTDEVFGFPGNGRILYGNNRLRSAKPLFSLKSCIRPFRFCLLSIRMAFR